MMSNVVLSTFITLIFSSVGFTSPQFGNIYQIQNYAKEVTDLWIKFKLDNSKQFSLEEDIFRFNVFKENLQRIDEYRKKFERGEIHFQVGISQFADLTKQEFVNKFLTLKMPQGRFKRGVFQHNRTTRQVNQYMDWRNQGAVTSVKNQGNCASCWAFSAVASLEGQYYRRYGNLISMSEQNLIDCSVDNINNGCSGGWMENAFQYLSSNSITSENEYSYIGKKQNCNYEMKNFRVSIQGYQSVPPDEQSLLQAVATVGPISVAMDATNLQFYAGGVFRDDECVPGKVNHGILVVGYGTEDGRDYWIAKNSWGSSWGEQGYFKMIRNRGNQCSIASYGMYPIL